MTADDEVAAIAAVILAFAADPVTRWTWPHPHQYLAAMPRFVRAFGGGAFRHGGVRLPRAGFGDKYNASTSRSR